MNCHQLTAEGVRILAEQLRRKMPSDTEGVDAYNRGKSAKRAGAFRVSPYYQKPFLDAAWLRGFDDEAAKKIAVNG